jgi:hypothetical protein
MTVKRKPFFDIVKHFCTIGFHDPLPDFQPKSTIYDDGEYFISELYDDFEDSYLYFKKIGNEYFAFASLTALDRDFIPKVKQALIDGDTKGNFVLLWATEFIKRGESKKGAKK